ncbi:MAG: threonine--tRNA ligase, partial [Candidatus Altiarchaeota archaeon]|nr:threonine--tRNA ligase [Candidatus Altiarchaeota archaeon]
MRIITLHSDFIEFEPKTKAIKAAEEIKKEKKRIEDCLVVFSAAEKCDEGNVDEVAQKTVDEITKVLNQVKAKRVVLYPWVHLTTSPSSPDEALKLMKKIESLLGENVYLAPFGWYKSFNISVKGHPLAELGREIVPGKENAESELLKKERKMTSYWHILTPEGELHDVDKFNYKNHNNLKKFALHEKKKSRIVKEESSQIKLMRKLELADHEPASDSGNLRYYPRGRLIKSLIEDYVSERVAEYGGMEVETPIMYDIQHPTLKKYLQKFPARQYQIESDKRTFFLRFAACFGQFLMAHDATFSYRNLPFKIYELTRYSFRKEQSGELMGLRRLRAFTMPDVHAMVADMEQAIDEYKVRFDLSLNILDNIGIANSDVEMALRTTKDFFEKNKKFIVDLVKKLGKPVLLELWDERLFYFVLKYEFNFVDTLDKASALSTDQIDVENAERYGITFTDKNGKQQHPLILHCSPSGAIERVMYALLEKAALDQKAGRVPQFPLWLSPVQVRVAPISDEFLPYAEELANELLKTNVRVDIDDRVLSVGKKIREAEGEWCSAVVVVGEKEKKSGKLSVRIRGKK